MGFDQVGSELSIYFDVCYSAYCFWLQKAYSARFFWDIKENRKNKNPAQQNSLFYQAYLFLPSIPKWQNRDVGYSKW